MTAGPPPWRVFDTPAFDGAQPADELGGEPAVRDTTSSRAAAAAPRANRLAVRPDVIAGFVAALGGLALAWLLASGGPSGSISLGGGTELTGSDDPSGTSAVGREVVVDVVGAVLRPGVYHLPGGSRIGDAIAAAGGFGPRVAADRVDRDVNLAAVVHDGEQVVVPSRDDAAARPSQAAATTGPGRAGGLIDLNTASESELDSLPGIGPVTAGKIVASRAGQPFRSVEELLQRKLVGQKTFDSIKNLVTVG